MLSLLVVCILIVFAVSFVKYSFWRKNYSQLVPSVPSNFFNVFGDLSEILLARDMHIQVMDKFLKRSKMFQKEGLMCFWFAYSPVIFLLKANVVKEALKEKKILEKSWLADFMKPIFGENLLISPEKKWRFQRKLLTPCFHSDLIRNYMITFNEESRKLVTVLQKETQEDFTHISKPIALSLLNIVSATIFGVSIEDRKDENEQYLQSLRRLTDIFMSRIYTPWLWPDILFWNSKIGKEFRLHITKMQGVTRSIIAEKRNRYLKGEKITVAGKRKAMMDLMLEKHFETKELSEEDIREEVEIFLVAGHETVASSITWALFLLGHHPEIQTKVHEELDRVFEGDRDRPVTEEDLKNMQYLDCVLKESHRLYPGVPIFARGLSEDTDLNGFPIPKGTLCLTFLYGLHRDEDVFPDPERFDPERFSAENRGKIPDCAYIPFAAGPRNCIGYKFAETEMRITLSWILRYFTLESLDARDKVLPFMSIGLLPSIPHRIRIRSRSIP